MSLRGAIGGAGTEGGFWTAVAKTLLSIRIPRVLNTATARG